MSERRLTLNLQTGMFLFLLVGVGACWAGLRLDDLGVAGTIAGTVLFGFGVFLILFALAVFLPTMCRD